MSPCKSMIGEYQACVISIVLSSAGLKPTGRDSSLECPSAGLAFWLFHKRQALFLPKLTPAHQPLQLYSNKNRYSCYLGRQTRYFLRESAGPLFLFFIRSKLLSGEYTVFQPHFVLDSTHDIISTRN